MIYTRRNNYSEAIENKILIRRDTNQHTNFVCCEFFYKIKIFRGNPPLLSLF